MSRKPLWTLEQGLRFVRLLEQALAPHYHVALLGSVLQKGESAKDIDIMIVPHTTERNNIWEIWSLLNGFGLHFKIGCDVVHDAWRKAGSADTKHVEVWTYRGKRVDVFIPYV